MVRSAAIQLFAMPLPWRVRRALLSRWLKFDLAPGATIGFSLVGAKAVRLARNARIGHGTMIKGLDRLDMGEGSILGNLNWVTGYPSAGSDYFTHVAGRSPTLTIGRDAAITHRHLIDCTDRVVIGDHTVLAGWGTQLITHSLDLERNRPHCAPVTISAYCFIGTRSIILPGVSVAERVVVGAGSVVTRSVQSPWTLVAGAPAAAIRAVERDGAYFHR